MSNPLLTRHKMISIMILVIVGILSYFAFTQPNITGWSVEREIVHVEDVNYYVDQNTNYSIILNEPPTSLRLSGSLTGQGSVKVYFDDILVLDNNILDDKVIKSISGFAAYDNEVSNIGIENTTTNETEGIAKTNYTELTTINKKITENVTITFTDICKDSCIIFTNKTNFSLKIEINGSKLNLTNIIYSSGLRSSPIFGLQNKTEIPVHKDLTTRVKGRVMINSDVMFIRTVKLDKKVNTLSVNIPKGASIIKVEKIDGSSKQNINLNSIKVKEKNSVKPIKQTSMITGSVIGVPDLAVSDDLGSDPTDDDIELIIEDDIEELEIEYTMPGPTSAEELINSTAKNITVAADMPFIDIWTYTSVPDMLPETIRLSRTRINPRY